MLYRPTSVVSFFGLFWFPYHDDLPYWVMFDALAVSCISAILYFLAPRFPRLLKAYRQSASPRLPFDGQKLLPKDEWWIVAFFGICFGGWLASSMGLSATYKFMSALALQSLLAALTVYIFLQAATVLWIYIRHYPEKPLLGLVTGLLWPPLHPLHRFLLRVRNKLGRLRGEKAPPAERPRTAESQSDAGLADPA